MAQYGYSEPERSHYSVAMEIFEKIFFGNYFPEFLMEINIGKVKQTRGPFRFVFLNNLFKLNCLFILFIFFAR